MNGSNAVTALAYYNMYPRQVGLDHRIHVTFNVSFVKELEPIVLFIDSKSIGFNS